MIPQQQDMQAKKESHVYVQKPDGEEINIEKSQEAVSENPESAKQTAENTPTKASGEVTDGEAG
ncbi:MAG: hypothetical protein JWR72_4159 [Flavisolibacter sp.]|jgi:hypothetical protein|nr:hypothetical protein [Flavisolibacter sp.]